MAEITERFARAVRILVGDGAAKQRLIDAYEQWIMGIEANEIPGPQRERLEALGRALCSVAPAGDESAVRATVRKMSCQDAGAHAETILSLCLELLEHKERAEPLKVVHTQRAPSVPRYVARRG